MVEGLNNQQAAQYLGIDQKKFNQLDKADGSKDGVIDLKNVPLFAKGKNGETVRVTSAEQFTDGTVNVQTSQTTSSVDMNVKGLHIEGSSIHVGGSGAEIDVAGEPGAPARLDAEEVSLKGEQTSTQTRVSNFEFADMNFRTPNSVAKLIKDYDPGFDEMLRQAGVNDVQVTEGKYGPFIEYKSVAGWSVKMYSDKQGNFSRPEFTQDEETGAYRFQKVGSGTVKLDGATNIIIGAGCNGADVKCKDGLQENIVVANGIKNVTIKSHDDNDEFNLTAAGNTTVETTPWDKQVFNADKMTHSESKDGTKTDNTYDKNGNLVKTKISHASGAYEEYDGNGVITKKVHGNTTETYENGILSKRVEGNVTTYFYENGNMKKQINGNRTDFFNEDGVLEKYELSTREKEAIVPSGKFYSKEVVRNRRTTYDANGKVLSFELKGTDKDDNYYRFQELASDGTVSNDLIKENGKVVYKKATTTDANGDKKVTYLRVHSDTKTVVNSEVTFDVDGNPKLASYTADIDGWTPTHYNDTTKKDELDIIMGAINGIEKSLEA